MAKAKTTQIGTPTAETRFQKMRGKDTLSEIVGKLTYTETFYFIVAGRMPTKTQTRCLDACLTILMDHGLTPNALVARMTWDSVPDDLQVSIAAGILMVGNKFVGTVAGAGRLLHDGLKGGQNPRAWAADTVAKFNASKRRIPGFGHPYYQVNDPRTERLFEVARSAGVEGRYIDLLRVLGEEVDRAAGKHLTINVTGAIGAVLCEIEFPVEVMRAVPIISKAAGFVGQVREEMTNGVTQHLFDWANSEIIYEDPV